ncbi:MAG: transcriptional regulator, MarR family [Solirubrobacterales bacterium]|jgi:DNA-binding MarR family transcriptional regulator|nr:transcriptional regulator, MarR family [Solirubrobacterales bacterium]
MKAAETTPASAPLSAAGLRTWKAFLRAHSRLAPELDQELRERHGFALGDLDVLAQLAEAPGGRLRMCDLAQAVVLSPSGLSRRVDRLERAELVTRERAGHDARNIEARLTPAGNGLLVRLRASHRAAVKARFADRFSTEELETLAELLGRLTDES